MAAMFPHPMYTVGYAFYYGMTLLSQSYFVLYVSVFAHFAQLFFLAFAENPRTSIARPTTSADVASASNLIMRCCTHARMHATDIEKTYPEMCEDENEERARKELEAHYFRSDLIVFKNFNIFRSSDLFMAVTMLYVAMQFFFDLNPTFYFGYIGAHGVLSFSLSLPLSHTHLPPFCVQASHLLAHGS